MPKIGYIIMNPFIIANLPSHLNPVNLELDTNPLKTQARSRNCAIRNCKNGIPNNTPQSISQSILQTSSSPSADPSSLSCTYKVSTSKSCPGHLVKLDMPFRILSDQWSIFLHSTVTRHRGHSIEALSVTELMG